MPKVKVKINLHTSTPEELEWIAQSSYGFDDQAKEKVKKRLFLIKLRNLVNDEYWDNLGQTGTIFTVIPDSIKRYREILNDADPKSCDAAKLRNIKKIAESKKEKDILDPVHSNHDDESVKNKRNRYWFFKRLVGQYTGVNYPDKINASEIEDHLNTIQQEIDPDYQDDKRILYFLTKIVNDEIFWVNKGLHRFTRDVKLMKKENVTDPDKYDYKLDYMPRIITDLREILRTNTITQKKKLEISLELLKKHRGSETPDVNRFMKIAYHAILTKQSGNLETIDRTITIASEIRNTIGKNQTSEDIVTNLLYRLAGNDGETWNTKGRGLWGKKIIPDGIKKVRQILNYEGYNDDVKLILISTLMQTKTKDHKNRTNSLFRINPDSALTGLYQEIYDTISGWHGHLKLDGLEHQHTEPTNTVEQLENTQDGVSSRIEI